MFGFSDARDYSFAKVPYFEREEKITDQSNFFRIKFISCVSKSVQNLNLTSSQKVMCEMNVRSIKLKFSLDVVVTIMFCANFMNEQTQNNRQRSRF